MSRRFFARRRKVVSCLEKWTEEKLFGKHKSIQSNPSIAQIFFRCGLIEAWGHGIEKICNECNRSGNKFPSFDISDCGFMVKFEALESALIRETKTNDKSREKSREKGGAKVVELIKGNSHITTIELAESIGMTRQGVEKIIKQLKTDGILSRVGARKFGHWEVVES